ncbi:MAG: DoxX family membrane protein [Gemmatimonadetes bacterium]|nr:DoxX family membrane protein [Gemmatimonadota bacterium]NIO32922.1 DoxX family membrane protein [Gemmatimonadota bacterium]
MRWFLARYLPEWGTIPLRLALGLIFMSHGWAKLTGPVGTPEGFNIESWGWPYPVFWAWVVALIETFGGLLVIVGLFTRLAAFFIACVMIVAILKLKLNQGLIGGSEFEVALLMIALALLVTGAGRLSVDRDVLGWGAPPKRSRVGDTPYD